MEVPSLAYIKKLSNGNVDFEIKILNVLKDEFQAEKETYYNLLAKNNNDDVSKIVHKIKHKIAILSLEKGHELASQYEENLRQNHTALQSEFQVLLDNISVFINQID